MKKDEKEKTVTCGFCGKEKKPGEEAKDRFRSLHDYQVNLKN
jgi:hypothetical protein